MGGPLIFLNRRNRMIPKTKTVGRSLGLALLIGALAVIVGLWGLVGSLPVSAQTDTTAPIISSIAITSDTDDDDSSDDDDGVYGINDSIEVTVTFDEDVVVTGTPQLELDIGGGTGKLAGYESVDGSEVVFSYTVAVGDSDDDGIAIGANKLSLNGGSIKDAADNAADLSHTAVAAQQDHQVDGVRPTISSVSFGHSSYGRDGVYTPGEKLISSVKFNEDVIVTGTPQLELDFEGTAKLSDFDYAVPKCEPDTNALPVLCAVSTGPGAVRGTGLVFDYTVLSDDLDSDGIAIGANAVSLNGGAIKDAAGNDAVLTHEAVAEDVNYKVFATNAAASALKLSGIIYRTYAENGTAQVATYAVTNEADGATITWFISGDDSGDFSISSAGVISFSTSPDFESPVDADTDNVYLVKIHASDGTSGGTLDLRVRVTDVNEGPMMSGG